MKGRCCIVSFAKKLKQAEICEDHVVRNQEEVQKILKCVSQIISKSYIRRMNEKCESVKPYLHHS